MEYKTKWRKKREHILRRDHYRSVLSARYGKMVEADTVHHILPVEFFPEYGMTDWNLISVTRKEHNELHDRETHTLTSKGMDLAMKTARAHGVSTELVLERIKNDH